MRFLRRAPSLRSQRLANATSVDKLVYSEAKGWHMPAYTLGTPENPWGPTGARPKSNTRPNAVYSEARGWHIPVGSSTRSNARSGTSSTRSNARSGRCNAPRDVTLMINGKRYKAMMM